MTIQIPNWHIATILMFVIGSLHPGIAFAQEVQSPDTKNQSSGTSLHAQSPHHNPPNLSVVSNAQWQKIDRSVDAALQYLQKTQSSDGSIPTMRIAQPAVTSLYVMAALSAGHKPGDGDYGESINRAIDYVVNCQLENGLFSLEDVDYETPFDNKAGQLALYNHGICGTMLGEVYGMTDSQRAIKVRTAIDKAIVRLWELKPDPINPIEKGGWRYVRRRPHARYGQSDLSVTSWQIMFLRSIKNAGFDVPEDALMETMDYVRRSFVPATGEFRYLLVEDRQTTRGMTGAGLLCLFLTGNYDDQIERTSGQYLLRQSFARYNTAGRHDRYFYAAYYCSQAAWQMGGKYWEHIYLPLATTLVQNQRHDGSWHPDHHNREYRSTYSTAMAILALTPPHQLLPIYQR